MFRTVRRSSSGALTIFAASGLHTHVVTGRTQVWVGTGQFPLGPDYDRSPHAYVNQRLQIQLELLMTSGMPLETCWARNERWNNKFYYKVASWWLFLLSWAVFNPLAYTAACEAAGLARSINTQPAVRRNSETNPTSQHNRGMYWSQ